MVGITASAKSPQNEPSSSENLLQRLSHNTLSEVDFYIRFSDAIQSL